MFFRYADGECSVTIKETVMGKDVFVVSPTHSNDSLIEMLLMIAAARRWVEKWRHQYAAVLYVPAALVHQINTSISSSTISIAAVALLLSRTPTPAA